MKILLCHNYYQQRGGEDLTFEAESQLLQQHGHEVTHFTRHNDAVNEMGHLKAAACTLWNRSAYRDMRQLLRERRPDVMHCTNTFPLISPSVYYAAKAERVPVVQSLHNYRMLCINGCFLRNDRVCEDCTTSTLPWPAVIHKCYRKSRAASFVAASMLVLHGAARTWSRMVSRYVALTEFSRQRFVAAGMAPARIAVKPNFIDPDPGAGPGGGGYAVFIGRLSAEKGIKTMLSAWQMLGGRLRLKIIGDGPLAPLVQEAAAASPDIEWLGFRKPEELLNILSEATCLVMPSIWYETFGRTIIEAYAKGTPVVASRLGAMAELVDEGQTGLLFEPGNAANLAAKITALLDESGRLARMRVEARKHFERKFTAETNYQTLMDIYRDAAN